MKRKYLILLVFILAISACTKELDSRMNLPPTDDELMIRSGISYTECMGYCTAELTITHSFSTLKRISNNGQKIQATTWPTPEETWQKLLAQIDTQQLSRLPVYVTCQNCTNASTEWLEIQHDRKVFQTNFSSLDTIPAIAPLLQQLHPMYTQKQPNTHE